MADPRIVTAYAELPGSSNHHDFQLPWMFDETEHSMSEQTSSPQNSTKSPISISRFQEIGVDGTTAITSPTEHSLTTKNPNQGDISKAVKELAEGPKLDLMGQMRKSGFAKPLRYVTGLMRSGSLSPREEKGHSESSIDDGILASGGFSTSTSVPSGSLRRLKKLDTSTPHQLPNTSSPVSASVKVNRPKPQSSKSEGYNEKNSRLKEFQSQRLKPQSSPTGSARERQTEKSSNTKEAKMSTMWNDPRRATGDENLLATLKRYDTVFLVDDSASMAQDGHWEGAQVVLKALAHSAIRYDTDGIDLHFLNSPEYLKNTKSIAQILDKVQSIQPEGDTTPTETRLEEILNSYLERIEKEKGCNDRISKPLNLVVVTDGIADDIDTLISIIRQVTSRLDTGHFPLNQIGIQFVQIGNDKHVERALRVLDNHLQSKYGVSRDMIDTTKFLGETPENFIIKCLLGGINRRVDRMHNSTGFSS